MTRLTASQIEADLDNARDLGFWLSKCDEIDAELARLYSDSQETKDLRNHLQDLSHGLDLLYADYLEEERREDRWERAARVGIARWRELYDEMVTNFVCANVNLSDERFRCERAEFALTTAVELIEAYQDRDSPAYSFVELANKISRVQDAEAKWDKVKP